MTHDTLNGLLKNYPEDSDKRYTFQEYQADAAEFSHKTAIGDDTLAYALMGLSGESGELLNKYKKVYRDHNGIIPPHVKEHLIDEMGDCLWYIAEACSILGVWLDGIAERNIDKLTWRDERGTIKGEGDDR